MKHVLFAAGALAVTLAVQAEDKPLLAVPGKAILESKLDAAPGAPWKIAKGAWELTGGVWRGSEKPEDKHGAVIRLPNTLADFVIEFECKFEGGRSTSLSINAAKGHLARIAIMPKFVTIQKDDGDHEGPDKAVLFARFAVDFAPGAWHKVRLEMVGDTLLGKVDDLVAWGSEEKLKQERVGAGFTVGGQSVDFRNLSIREATLNPDWEKVKATLPKPGEKLAPLPAPAGKAPAKKKAAAKKAPAKSE